MGAWRCDVLSALLVLCVLAMVGDVAFSAVRREHHRTLARYGIHVDAPAPRRGVRSRTTGVIGNYVVLGDELLVELDVRTSEPGANRRWARCDSSRCADRALSAWRSSDALLTIEDRHGFLTLRGPLLGDEEVVQLHALAQPPLART